MKHTKGKVNYDINTKSGFDIYIEGTVKTIAETFYKNTSYMPTKEEAEANAELITDAFNTTSESGLTPSEILKQNKELLEALKEANNTLKMASLIDKSTQCEETQKLVQQAINNASK